MATTISRAWLTAQIDDDGSGTTGSVIDKADFATIFDALDAMFAGAFVLGSSLGVTGNVGIGTTTPARRLHQVGGTALLQPASGVADSAIQIDLAAMPVGSNGVYLNAPAAWTGAMIKGAVAGVDTFSINAAGFTTIAGLTSTTPLAAGGIFNSTHTDGSILRIQKNAGNVLVIGSSLAAGAGGLATDAIVYATAGKLAFESSGGIFSNGINGATDATPANLCINTGTGRITRSSSSLRYKTAVRPLAVEGWRWLLNLTPVSFTSIHAPEGRRYGALNAEDVARHGPRGADGSPMYAGLNADGEPEDVAYDFFAGPLVLAVQNLEPRLRAIERALGLAH